MLARAIGVITLSLMGGWAAAQPAPNARVLPERPAATYSRIRPQLEGIAWQIAAGYIHSPTFRALVDEIERLSVLVYVHASLKHTAAGGSFDILGAEHGQKIFVIFISPDLSFAHSIAMIAHELRHAVETAADPGVVDRHSLRRLYQRIGTAGVAGGYDTHAARETGSAVLSELLAGGDLEAERPWPALLERLPPPVQTDADEGA